jgi:predicted lipoprotein with Yx(FWY)xxD motif
MRAFLKFVTMMMLIALGAVAVAQMEEQTPADQLAVHEHEVLGSYLTDAQGRTLYVVVDENDESVGCAGECADAWPPFTLESLESMMGESMSGESMSDDAMAMASVDAMLAGTVERMDGTTQLTYQGHPLYYFVGDEEPGEVNCQAIENFGGTWYVISPSGEIVKTAL